MSPKLAPRAKKKSAAPKSVDQRVGRVLAYVCGGVLALLPFHALFTTWLGSNFGHLDVFRIWKEIVLVACIPPGVYLAAKSQAYKQWLKTSWLARLILGYFVLAIGLGLVALKRHDVNGPALVYGLFADLRYLGFFLLVVLVMQQTDWLRRWWAQLVLVPATVVVVFGLLQRLVLPYDFLKHVGYGPKTIPAYQTVDNKIDYRRIQSTLRGANPLGAYLVIITGTLAAWFRQRWALVLAAVTLAALYFSYSRSAYIGAALAAGLVIYISVKSATWRRRAVVFSLVMALVGAGAIIGLRHNRLVENTFFHTDQTSHSVTSSNADRATALKNGWRDVQQSPLGRGPGTAGPASERNNHPARIAENYFLQLGQEMGWLGLAIYITISVLMARDLGVGAIC